MFQVATPLAARAAGDVRVVAVERAPSLQRLEKFLPILLAHRGIEGTLLGGLRQQLGHMALVIRFDLAIAPRLTAERTTVMQIRVVVDLDERFQRNAEPLAVIEHAAMVVRDPPRAGIDIKVFIELAMLGRPAELGVSVTAAQAPVAATGAAVELQHLHLVAGVTQLVGGGHARHAGTQHQHRSAAPLADRSAPDREIPPQSRDCSWPGTWRPRQQSHRSCPAARVGSTKQHHHSHFPS